MIGGCPGLGVEGGTEKDYRKMELFGMMQLFHIPTVEAVTRTHTWTEIHRTLHQKNNFYFVPVIHSLPLCSTFILRCLLQILEHGPLHICLLPAGTVWSLGSREPWRDVRRKQGCLPASGVLVQQALEAHAVCPSPGSFCMAGFSGVRCQLCKQVPKHPALAPPEVAP